MRKMNFVAEQRVAQADFFARTTPPEAVRPDAGYRLIKGRRDLNLAPQIRQAAEAYFGTPRNIAWHRHADHGLSSQACCLNFLAPLARQPALLARVIGGALEIAPPRMLPVEDGPGDEPWYVGFEWIGRADHLSEWPEGGIATRGANATSADAVVRFEHEGLTETLLIEWKYTESYGTPIDAKGNPTRMARYRDKAFAPNGPLRADLDLKLEDFFWEPFYQLLRQQMLAWRMAHVREDGVDRVRVLHISPAGNRAVHRVTSPALRRFGDDAFEAFRRILVRPDHFVARTTEQVFGSFVASAQEDPVAGAWAAYLRDRYRFLATTPTFSPGAVAAAAPLRSRAAHDADGAAP